MAATATDAPDRSVLDEIGATWVIGWADARRLAMWAVGMIVVYVGIGEMITASPSLESTDRDVSRWFEDHRTETGNSLATWGAGLSDTIVKVIATTIIVGIMLWVWRRWTEALIVAVTLILEATVFIIVTTIVGRPRPPVEQLQESPVNSSFPSGHVAAAAAYFAIAVVLSWHTRRAWLRWALWIAVGLTTVIVAVSRLYQGMHYLSDVVAGAVLGVVSVVVTVHVIRGAHERSDLDPITHRDRADAATAETVPSPT